MSQAQKLRYSLLWRILLAFLLLAVIPVAGLGWGISYQLENVRQLIDETALTFEHQAKKIAGKVSGFLRQCEADLRELTQTPRDQQAYLDFANRHQRLVWLRSGTNENPSQIRQKLPTYKEVSFIDLQGKEQILIARGRSVPDSQLRNVADPKNTTYRGERYFVESSRNPIGQIYVSHLNGFHVDRISQLGVEKIIQGLPDVAPETKRIYRYLLYVWFQAAAVVEYVSSFKEDDHQIHVYRIPGEDKRILVDDPGALSDQQLQAYEIELKAMIDKLAPEDVVEGARYDGVIRFATAVADQDGKPVGVVALALDHLHLMQFTQHVKSMKEDAVVFAGYREADYTYLFDDQGWIITHPKYWNIRGVDRKGQPVPAYHEDSSPVEKLVGRTPVNLMQLDWKMGPGYHKVVLSTQAHQTGVALAYNLSNVWRTRVYSPVFYDTGVYQKHGIFGGVMLGTQVETFISLLRKMNTSTAEVISQSRRSLVWPLVIVLVLVCGLSIVIARSLVQPIRALRQAAMQIGEGDLDTEIPIKRADEIGDLAVSFSEMRQNLKQTFEKLSRSNLELRQAQSKLLEAEKEKQRKLEQEVAQLQQEITRSSFANMIAQSGQMKKIQEEIVRVAKSNATVLILGANGTGKELVAEAIHRNSARRDKRFVRVNCAAFNDNLLESELFGHTRGAYTGASVNRKGLFETANGGTLLLDEVGDMSLEMQKKLLRTLQEGEIVPLGSSRVLKVDVRIVAATNQDLAQQIKDGAFREDLFHRLNVISIHIPPLRERKDDILPLSRLFLKKFADKEDKHITGLSLQTEKYLLEYHWPGNVRELENAMERAVIRARSAELTADDFQLEVVEVAQPEVVQDGLQNMSTLAEMEKAYILSVLDRNGGNKKLTAKILDIGYNTLWRKLKKYDQE